MRKVMSSGDNCTLRED